MNVKWSRKYLSRELSAANFSHRVRKNTMNDISIEIQMMKCKKLRVKHRINSKGALYKTMNVRAVKKNKAIAVGTNKYSQLRRQSRLQSNQTPNFATYFYWSKQWAFRFYLTWRKNLWNVTHFIVECVELYQNTE